MKLIEEPDDSVSVISMQDGDIAIITKWNQEDEEVPYIGRIVMRFGVSLLTLGYGQTTGRHWSKYFEDLSDNPSCKVKILKKGQIYKFQI